MRGLDSLILTLQSQGYDGSVVRTNGIPHLEVWRSEGVLALREAISIANTVREGLYATIHFYQLSGRSIEFFVYDKDATYSAAQFEDYGTPLDEWLAGVQKGLVPERFTMRGDANIGDVPPTQNIYHSGFIWERPEHFFSTDQSGKWCVVREAKDVDALWAQVRQAVRQGKFAAALVSSPQQAATHGGTYVICAFTNDWQDKASVDAAREVLRGFGVTEELGYKRDLDTINGVYGTPEEWAYRG